MNRDVVHQLMRPELPADAENRRLLQAFASVGDFEFLFLFS